MGVTSSTTAAEAAAATTAATNCTWSSHSGTRCVRWNASAGAISVRISPLSYRTLPDWGAALHAATHADQPDGALCSVWHRAVPPYAALAFPFALPRWQGQLTA